MPVRRRGWRGAATVAAVLALHALVLRWVDDAVVGWGAASQPAMPVRMEVAFVQVLAPAEPPARAAAPAPAPTAAPRRARPRPRVQPPQAAASAASARAPTAAVAQVDVPVPPPDLAPAVEPPGAAASPAAGPEPAVAPASEPPGAPSGPPAASAPPAAVPFEWPPSTRLTYVLSGNYRGELHGNARVQWVREGARYQVHVDVAVGPSFAPLISRRMTSDGTIAEAGLQPQRYDELTKLPFQAARRSSVVFTPEQVTLANGRTAEAMPGVQDAASQFVHLTWFFTLQPERLRVGQSVHFPLALPRRMDRWTYDIVGREALHTPVGELDTFHLKPRRAAERPQGELSAEMWIAPTLQYLPVRIRIQQDAETFVDLMLDAAPLQAAPR